MAIDSSDALVAALAKTQLLEAADLEAVRKALPASSSDVQEMAQSLIKQGRLTNYQAKQVLTGKAETLVLGGYRILEPLGEGGMGEVFKAEQSRLNRIVALKVIRKNCLSTNPESVRRFQREALAAAQLSHPNVITIYDAGQDQDTHFIVMEYVEGMDLGRLVEAVGPLPIPVACDFIGQAALGLQHAHERGMVHRDIKPSNLLVTRPPVAAGSQPPESPGETTQSRAEELLRGGLLKILDMGLARLVQTSDGRSESALTEEGKVVGTPDFIAPEQARSSRQADSRADVYSLGCTFYYLLCGRAPFPEGNFVEKLLMHQLDEPESLAKLRPEVPPGIVAVVNKMMAKRPEDRYQAPFAVCEALAAISARKDSGAALPATPLPPASNTSADASRVTPVIPSPVALPLPPADTPVPTKSRANSWTGLKPGEAPRSDVPTQARELATLQAHKGCAVALAFSPDRNTLASAGVDQAVRVWDFTKRPADERACLPTPGVEVSALTFLGDPKLLIGGTNKGKLCLWDLSPETPVLHTVVDGHRMSVTVLVCSPNGQALVSGGADGESHFWELEGGKLHRRGSLPGRSGEVTAMAVSADGKRVATGCQDGSVHLWTPGWFWQRGELRVRLAPCAISSLAFSSDGQLLACGTVDQTVHLLEVGPQEIRKRPRREQTGGRVRLVHLPPGGTSIVTLEDKGRKCVYDLDSGGLLESWVVRVANVYSYALTHDGRYLATGCSDGTVIVYRVAPKREKE